MSINNWYVITGSSCSGKTTLVKKLAERGYKVVYEAARVLIDQELAKGLTLQEIRKDEQAFQDKVLQMKIDTENSLDKNDIVFFDRAIPDTVAYRLLYNSPIDPILKQALAYCRYKKVFILDQLPYEIDDARTESKEQQDKLHELLGQTYKDLNFEIITVPILATKDERADFVLKNL